MYCSKCGASSDGKFCPACGSPMSAQPEAGAQTQPETGSQTQRAGAPPRQSSPLPDGRDILDQVKREKKKFDRFVGADENVHIKVSDLFSGILKKHTKEEQDEILICGTSKTTPPESEISAG